MKQQLRKGSSMALIDYNKVLERDLDHVYALTVDLKQWCNNFLAQLPADFPQERKKKIKRTLDMELYRWDKIESEQKIYSDPYYWAPFTLAGRFS